MPTMGTHGSGTVQKLPNGRFRVAVTMPDGRRVWRRARTERQAERIRRELVEARELDLDPTRQTVAGYLRSWIGGLASARNARVRPRTLDHYELIVERHIIPALGALPLARLSGRRVQAWIDADPAAPRTVRHHHAVLRRALNVAVKQRLLAYNPANAVELPDLDADVARPLTLDEAHRLLEATRDDRLGVLWRLAMVTGLRQGELLGLSWEDLDLGDLRGSATTGADRPGRGVGADHGLRPGAGGPSVGGARPDGGVRHDASITVRAQLQRLSPDRGGDDAGWALTPTKSARGVNRIAIDAETAAMLDAHRRRMAAERQPETRYFGLVFRTTEGTPYHGSEALKPFKRACVAAGLSSWVDEKRERITPNRRFHDLRHTSLTLLKDVGVAEDTRMARAGHSTTAMARHYGKASEAQDREAADRLGRALG